MLDIRFVRENPEIVKENIKKKFQDAKLPLVDEVIALDAQRRAAILEAEGEKESAILRADAKKQQQILEAQGEAEAILTVQRATADGIKLLNEAAPTAAIIQLKSLEAFAAAADGKATKIIIPSEIQGIAGLAAGLMESVKPE